MNKQLLTLALITTLLGSAVAGTNTGEKDKNKNSNTTIIELPVLTEWDLEEISAELEFHTALGTIEIAPQTYQIFDSNNDLIKEETVQFENSPSGDIKALMRKGEFLMEKGDLLIYKVF
ncbi:MAG: hypothetical protein RIF33_02425 [Cyclobacteriaceae bacterium]